MISPYAPSLVYPGAKYAPRGASIGKGRKPHRRHPTTTPAVPSPLAGDKPAGQPVCTAEPPARVSTTDGARARGPAGPEEGEREALYPSPLPNPSPTRGEGLPGFTRLEVQTKIAPTFNFVVGYRQFGQSFRQPAGARATPGSSPRAGSFCSHRNVAQRCVPGGVGRAMKPHDYARWLRGLLTARPCTGSKLARVLRATLQADPSPSRLPQTGG